MGVLFVAHYINFFGVNSRDLRRHVDYLASLTGALTAWARLEALEATDSSLKDDKHTLSTGAWYVDKADQDSIPRYRTRSPVRDGRSRVAGRGREAECPLSDV
jgi:hypothetical protein